MWNPVLIPRDRDWVLSVTVAALAAPLAILLAQIEQGVVMSFSMCVCLRAAMKGLHCARRAWDGFLWIGLLLSLAAFLIVPRAEAPRSVAAGLIYPAMTAWFLVLAVFGAVAIYRARRNLGQAGGDERATRLASG